MAGHNVFHVEFGINETELTQTLERKQWSVAERLIKDNAHSSYLSEGCYQRTPLYIALCGAEQDEDIPAPRHLKIALLLLQHGAAVNFRVPATYFGSEYRGPGKSALELIVEFYNTITAHSSHVSKDSSGSRRERWDPWTQPVIGVDNRSLTDIGDVIEQLCDVAFIMLGNGGDPNILDELRMTLLHRTAVISQDSRMLQLLCDNGAALNAVDHKGNTPLGALCDPFPFGLSTFLEVHPDADPYNECCILDGKENFLQHLVQQKDVSLDVQNKYDWCPLFSCMVKGDLTSCLTLLNSGCDPSLKGRVWLPKGGTRRVSPLFAALFSRRMISDHRDKYRAHHIADTHFMAHMVDSGVFTQTSDVTTELLNVIQEDFPEFHELEALGPQLLKLMFGGTSSSLRQLCVRHIFQRYVLRKSARISTSPSTGLTCGVTSGHSSDADEQRQSHDCDNHSNIEESDYASDVISSYHRADGYQMRDTRPGEIDNPWHFDIHLKYILTKPKLERLIRTLHLPQDALRYFELELFRQRLCSDFRQLHWFRGFYDEDIDGSWGRATDSEDLSSDENDSDLEYW